MTKAAIAKKPPPPRPEPRKEIPVNTEYEEKAKALLRYAMAQKGIGIEELAERLDGMGIKISAGGLANKISRGSFSSGFLLQCMEAMDINLAALPR